MKQVATWLLLAGAAAALIVAAVLPARVGHPVTPWMAAEADAVAGRAIDGSTVANRARPLIVVFILPGCPCSEEYEPHTHEMFRRLGERVDFLGVVAGDAAEAAEWQRAYATPFPVVADPSRAIARQYGAKRSAYTALSLDGRTVVRLWPGYSAAMLREVVALAGEAVGQPQATLDVGAAPERLTSGCPIDL